MPVDPYQKQPVEFDETPSQGRLLSWGRILAVALVLLLIIGINVYFSSPQLQRRGEYAWLRVQTAFKKLRPHDLYLPTPVAPSQAQTQAPALTPTLVPTPVSTPGSAPTLTTPMPTSMPTSTPSPTPSPTPFPTAVYLAGKAKIYEAQGWNNCGPATLAMALRLHGWTGDQYTIAAALKPGKDDKNISPQEMVSFVSSTGGMFAVTGYAADTSTLKLLLSNGFPVIVETWFIPEPGDEMGHYRLLVGYDDGLKQFTTHDSYRGTNKPISYEELDTLWKVFNRAFVVVCGIDRASELQNILGDTLDTEAMYRKALSVALDEIAADPEDRYAWFNAGTNYAGLQQYKDAVAAYDQARTLKLPWRMLWYQFGPFEAYLGAGRYQDVVDLANANVKISKNLEESYYYRALARRELGDQEGAQQDLRKALQYNPYFRPAAEALGR